MKTSILRWWRGELPRLFMISVDKLHRLGVAPVVSMRIPWTQNDNAYALLIGDLRAAFRHDMDAAKQAAIFVFVLRLETLVSFCQYRVFIHALRAIFGRSIDGGARVIPVAEVPSL